MDKKVNMACQYKRIAVAVDFSEHSQAAVQKAMFLAEQNNAEIELIHIVEIPVYPVLEDIAVMGLPGVWDDEVASQLLDNSNKKIATLAKQNGIEQCHVITGLADADIVDYADKNNVDLIVMGSHGVSGIKRLIGSTVNAVINHASCDVLAVRIKEE